MWLIHVLKFQVLFTLKFRKALFKRLKQQFFFKKISRWQLPPPTYNTGGQTIPIFLKHMLNVSTVSLVRNYWNISRGKKSWHSSNDEKQNRRKTWKILIINMFFRLLPNEHKETLIFLKYSLFFFPSHSEHVYQCVFPVRTALYPTSASQLLRSESGRILEVPHLHPLTTAIWLWCMAYVGEWVLQSWPMCCDWLR